MEERLKSIKLTRVQYNLLFKKIQEDHPRSVWLMRSKIKEKLGFTPRFDYHRTVHLDFFNASLYTFFLMKYSDYLPEGSIK